MIATFAPMLLLPRWPIAVTTGLLYGLVLGTLFAVCASLCGAALQFVLARSWLSSRAERLKRRFRWTRWLERNDHIFTGLIVLRCTPVTHFSATNLVAGSLGISLPVFLASSFIGMIPSTAMYASMGLVARDPSPRYVWLMASVFVVVLAIGVGIPRLKYGRKLFSGGDA